MGIEVIQHENDFLHIRIHLIHQVFDLLCPIHCCAVFPDAHMVTPAKRFNERKYATGPLSLVFGINFFVIPQAHGPGVPDFSQKLIGFLVHAHNGNKGIIGQRVNIKDILHGSDEFRICYARDTPVLTAVRPKPVFLMYDVLPLG